ncbi:hypothetical protein EDD22DRAFT_1047999 [Suillus occidentalis]|nr:hypothetical protein EDD22DRAFT_1047999 [Suillus occidentalis]
MRFAKFAMTLAVVAALTSSISAIPTETGAEEWDCPSFCTDKSQCHHTWCIFKVCFLAHCFFMALTHEPLVNGVGQLVVVSNESCKDTKNTIEERADTSSVRPSRLTLLVTVVSAESP